MTEEEIVVLTETLMDEWKLWDWEFRMEDTLPSGRDGKKFNLAGHCHWGQKVIRLAREFVLDYPEERIVAIVQHEIAHALTEPESGHTDAWKAKLDYIRRAT